MIDIQEYMHKELQMLDDHLTKNGYKDYRNDGIFTRRLYKTNKPFELFIELTIKIQQSEMLCNFIVEKFEKIEHQDRPIFSNAVKAFTNIKNKYTGSSSKWAGMSFSTSYNYDIYSFSISFDKVSTKKVHTHVISLYKNIEKDVYKFTSSFLKGSTGRKRI